MKREITRTKRLPAFLIDIDEFGVLWDRLSTLFDSSERIYCNIEIKLLLETLEFDNFEELKQYAHLKGRITKFSFRMSQNERRVSVRTSSITNSLADVTVYAETEAWCAGAIEIVYSFIKSHQLWYNWFFSAPIGWILYLFTFIPSMIMIVLPKNVSLNKSVVIAWISITVTLAILYFFRGKLLSSAVIQISEEEGFFKKNAAELSLLMALIAIVLNIIGLFVPK